jgi:hypothetical protein
MSAFDFARRLHARALAHISEFRETKHWLVNRLPDTATERNRYELRLDRNALRNKEAIAADIANNLVHALDHVVAACVRLNGHPNTRDFNFPLFDDVTFKKRMKDDAKFNKRMTALEKKIGPNYAAALDRMRSKASAKLPHLLAMKEYPIQASTGNLRRWRPWESHTTFMGKVSAA